MGGLQFTWRALPGFARFYLDVGRLGQARRSPIEKYDGLASARAARFQAATAPTLPVK